MSSEALEAARTRAIAQARNRRNSKTLAIFLTAVAFLLAWEIVGRLSHPMFMAPASGVVAEFWRGITDPRARLWNGFLQTMSVLVPGFLISCALGIVIGVLMGRINAVYRALDPFVTVFYNTPRVALVPILMLWLGIDNTLKTVVVILAAVFPIIVNTLTGVRDISSSLTEPARSMGANEAQILRLVIVPAALPFIIAGLKLGLGRALTTVVVAEYFSSISGLGGLLQSASTSYNMARVFVPAAILALMGILIDALLGWIERSASRRYR
ncbi:MAG: ABC transporter permease [Rhodobacteraceae bacterium]|jgi:NitT/TauT family transport system permease protein|nr:ABC transporter permease [Paracoccaceae bacterium]